MSTRSVALLGVAALLAGALAGCDTARPLSCVGWVAYDGPQSAVDDATLVVVGVADPADGAIELTPGPGERHRIAVERVLKGAFDGDELWAAAPRDYCVEDPPQPVADPIPGGERILLLLRPAVDEVAVSPPADLDGIAEWSGLTPEWTALPHTEQLELLNF